MEEAGMRKHIRQSDEGLGQPSRQATVGAGRGGRETASVCQQVLNKPRGA